ncbi:MAG: type II toxin-antitoxin system RelE/ParE family toxin [Bacteroidales bacterium]|nr:type II toxin-antitoxin system RelE/ParE family toxin [Bacteroidales bacterium]MDE7102847.1 type II toxin-antitoxin system RelE/ParE family toxin [Bacteroidales bacterium]
MYRIVVYKRYYDKFIQKLSETERRKLLDVLFVFRAAKPIPPQCIKYLRNEIYELRVTSMGNALRLFFFYDGAKIVVLLNGFRKKSQKTPKREIEQAIKLKEAYYAEKEKGRTVVL